MIKENQCYLQGEKRFRVIYANEYENTVVLIDIDKNCAMPTACKHDEFEENIKNKIFIRIVDPSDKDINVLLDSQLSDKQRQKRNKNFDLISRTWVSRRNELLNKRDRRKLFKEISDEYNLSLSSVQRMYSRFWQRGMNRNAVLSDNRFSGVLKRKTKREFNKKNGRRSARKINGQLVVGKLLTDEDKQNIRKAYEEYFRSKHRPALARTYRYMLDKFYKDKLIINDAGETIPDPEQIPSYRQFYNEVRKYRNKYKDIVSRMGKNYYNLNYRPHLSGININGLTVCAEVQIDSAILNLEIVHSVTGEPIGKPIVFAATDTASKLVIGSSVGLNHDSWEGYSTLLLNIVSDKVEYCKELGIEIDKSQWPAEHLPKRILSDNGAFVSKNSAMLLNYYGVELEFAASYRPDMKSIIENLWHTYKAFIRDENIPGTVYEDSGERGGRPDPKKYACLTLRDVEKMIALITIKRNNSILEGMEIPIEMAAAGVDPIPVDMFNWRIKEYGEPEKDFDRDLFRIRMLPEGTATVTQEGIHFKDRDYVCDQFINENWEVNKLGMRFLCKYDPSLINILYIFVSNGPNEQKVIPCCLTPRYTEFGFLSKDEWDSYKKNVRAKERERKEEKVYKNIKLSEDTKFIVDGAKKRSKAIVKTGKKHVRNERKNEKNLRKLQRARDYERSHFKSTNQTKIDTIKRDDYDRNAYGLFDDEV